MCGIIFGLTRISPKIRNFVQIQSCHFDFNFITLEFHQPGVFDDNDDKKEDDDDDEENIARSCFLFVSSYKSRIGY